VSNAERPGIAIARFPIEPNRSAVTSPGAPVPIGGMDAHKENDMALGFIADASDSETAGSSITSVRDLINMIIQLGQLAQVDGVPAGNGIQV
jgi:hypothetical protein